MLITKYYNIHINVFSIYATITIIRYEGYEEEGYKENVLLFQKSSNSITFCEFFISLVTKTLIQNSNDSIWATIL